MTAERWNDAVRCDIASIFGRSGLIFGVMGHLGYGPYRLCDSNHKHIYIVLF